MSSAIMDAVQGPLCGTLGTLFLYGVICMQVFYYANVYGSSDRPAIKWLVGVIWILESVHTAFSIHVVEWYLALHFDDPDALNYGVWTMGASHITGFFVACAVGLFFVWRIWQLSKKSLICIFLAILVIVRTGFGITNCTFGFTYPVVKEYLTNVYPTMIAGWTVAALTDSLIAVTLCYYLHTQRNGVKGTDHVIKALVLYTINTGALTSFFDILVIITYLTLPGTPFTAFVQVQSKLWAVSLLTSLDARKRTLECARKTFPTRNNVTLPLIHKKSRGKPNRSLTPPIQIRKDVEQEIFPPDVDDVVYAV